jgi:hypothetical protein
MSRSNEFDEDPPTVVSSSFQEIKLPPPRIELRVDPVETMKFSVIAWTVKNSYWLNEVGGFIAILATVALIWALN